MQLATPPDQEEAARYCYAGVLGLTKTPNPITLAARRGI